MDNSNYNKEKSEAYYTSLRIRMVDYQLTNRGIKDELVLKAMRTVPRHKFIPVEHREQAYHDGPQPIGKNQTISQPFIVASMTEHLQIDGTCKVLEVGTGCGYQTAVLAEITNSVLSIERIPDLLKKANNILFELGYRTVKTQLGDGTKGIPEHAPYDGIIVTAASSNIPDALIEQLAMGGRMIIPVEESPTTQILLKIIKTKQGLTIERLYEVRFVPLIGD
ncbi:MAG: protein-L-isoaspartate(D-aspartate) O-methyltransferase [bacterium]